MDVTVIIRGPKKGGGALDRLEKLERISLGDKVSLVFTL